MRGGGCHQTPQDLLLTMERMRGQVKKYVLDTSMLRRGPADNRLVRLVVLRQGLL